LELNTLMNVEAVRAYAAINGGKLPMAITDLAPLPALPDPVAYGPFIYEITRLDGSDVAILRCDPAFPHRDRITVQLTFTPEYN
jgi:hypothetical protein